MDNSINITGMNMSFFSSRIVYANRSKADAARFGDTIEKVRKNTNIEKKSGHIEETLKKHPDWRKTVEKHIAGGEALKKAHPSCKSTEDMTMEEYKSYIGGIIDSIPLDGSHIKDDITINITDEGWETMKDDPQYESWLLGHTKENLTFHNPWASFSVFDGTYFVDNFGASIEEHHGVGIGKSSAYGKSIFDKGSEDSFWTKREKRADMYREEQKKLDAKNRMLEHLNEECMERQAVLADYYGEGSLGTFGDKMGAAVTLGVSEIFMMLGQQTVSSTV